MKILILGAGKMGSFFTDLLSFEHEVAVLENDPKRMRFIYNALRLQKPEEVAEFKPELVINCVTLSYTIEAFKSVMPYLQPYCIGQDASERILRDMRFPVCFHPPDVRPDIRQLRATGKRKYDHYLRRGSSGENILQRYLFQPAPTYLRIYFRRT